MTDQAQPPLRLYPDADRLVTDLAEVIADRLSEAIRTRGVASFVASGGSTPGALYDRLCDADIAWDKVVVTTSDERWVAPGAEGSNEKLVRDHLLQRQACAAHLVGLRTAHATPAEAETESHARLNALPHPFDVTLIGMGTDGHTASLYPRAPGLERALDRSRDALTAAVSPVDAVGSNLRLSLTLKALLDSRLIIVLIRGEEKLAVYRQALIGTDVSTAPIRALIHQTETPVQVWWAP